MQGYISDRPRQDVIEKSSLEMLNHTDKKYLPDDQNELMNTQVYDKLAREFIADDNGNRNDIYHSIEIKIIKLIYFIQSLLFLHLIINLMSDSNQQSLLKAFHVNDFQKTNHSINPMNIGVHIMKKTKVSVFLAKTI